MKQERSFRPARSLSALLMVAALAACGGRPAHPPVPPPAPEPPLEQPAHKPLVLKPDYPEVYEVQKGDTLWGISGRYLRDPWRWPELWQNNPGVINPHLIYPGDILTLFYVDGRPVMQVQRAGAPAPTRAPGRDYETIKLSPEVRVEPLARAIPTIPLDAISPFLNRPRIVGSNELELAPYVISSADEHLITGAGNRIYVRGLERPDTSDFVVVRRGRAYVNPNDDEDVLGYEAIHVADARLQRTGDPSTLLLTRTNREVLNGDRLMPADDGFVEQNYLPHAPEDYLEGRIVSVYGGVSQIGQYQMVVINLGLQEDLEAGHVFAVYQQGLDVRDPVTGDVVTMPPERAGTLMVFRVFDRLSFALVMEATRPMHVNDLVTTP